MNSPFAPIGREMNTSGQTCTHSPGDLTANDCGKKATWHIAWDTNLENGLACDPHMAEALARFMFVDRHRVGPECAMPGTAWDFDNKRCVYPDDPAPTEALAAALPADPTSTTVTPSALRAARKVAGVMGGAMRGAR
ncbi:hypothetical protein ACFWDF_30575 [Streptomyces diastaticus]|uniref:hypothetical protein n=1 Tax=Streptomyces diastaticus TaxID=1956 RepID=UPI0036C1EA0D